MASDSELKATNSLLITILQHRKPVQQLEPPYYSAITITFQRKMDSQIIGRLTQSKEHSTNVDTYGAWNNPKIHQGCTRESKIEKYWPTTSGGPERSSGVYGVENQEN